MARLLRTHGIRGEDEQAREFHSRERRRSLLEPVYELNRTHEFASGDTIDPDESFADPDRPATFAVDIARGAGTPNGVVFEFGGATTGVALWVEDESVFFSAGGSGSDGVTIEAENVLVGSTRIRVVASVIPGNGSARLWVNGRLRARGTSAGGPLPNGLFEDAAGEVGDVAGAINANVPGPQAVALANASIVSKLAVYLGQFPRQFNDGLAT